MACVHPLCTGRVPLPGFAFGKSIWGKMKGKGYSRRRVAVSAAAPRAVTIQHSARGY